MVIDTLNEPFPHYNNQGKSIIILHSFEEQEKYHLKKMAEKSP